MRLATPLLLVAAGCVGTGAAPGNDPCDTGQVTLTFGASTASDTCFVAPGIDNGDPSNVLSIGATTTSGSAGGGTVGIQLVFSADPTCTFAPGATIQLSDPCLFVGEAVGDPAIPTTLYGVVSSCAFSGTSVSEMDACGAAGSADATTLTTGSITLNQWSTQSGGEVQVTFSSNAALTALNPGTGATSDDFAVPVSGSVIGFVPSQ